MKTKRQKIKELEEELIKQKEKYENEIKSIKGKYVLMDLEYKRQARYLEQRLYNVGTNPMIVLPNSSIMYKDLNEEQLEYLESLTKKK